MSPFFLNYLLIGIYAANALQFVFRGFYWDGVYWLGALAITITVTFGYDR